MHRPLLQLLSQAIRRDWYEYRGAQSLPVASQIGAWSVTQLMGHWIVWRLTGLRDRFRCGSGCTDELALLAPLLQLVPPAPLPVGLLARIEAQIDAGERRMRAGKPENQHIWLGMRTLSAGVAGALAGGVVSALLALPIMLSGCAPAYLTTLELEQPPLSLRIDSVACGRYIHLHHFGSGAVADHALELWLVPQSGGVPRSLGLVSAKGDSTVLLLETPVLAGDVLAISQEPPMGSPFDRPSGPVLVSAMVGEN